MPRSMLEGLVPMVQSESQGMQTTGWSRVPRRAGEDESPLDWGSVNFLHIGVMQL